MNKRLDYLLRKNKGDKMFSAYRDVFVQSGFKEEELKHISLEETDEVMAMLQALSKQSITKYEVVSGNCRNIECSALLSDVFNKFNTDNCYVYTDSYEFCGMFLCKISVALSNALNLASSYKENTLYILSTNYQYSFAINYGDISDYNFPNEFDIRYRTR